MRTRDMTDRARRRGSGDWPRLELIIGQLARLGILVAILLVGGTLGFVATEDTSVWGGVTWTLDTIEAGDVLVVMGTPETIGRLEEPFTP